MDRAPVADEATGAREVEMNSTGSEPMLAVLMPMFTSWWLVLVLPAMLLGL